MPSIATLGAICEGFGITLSQFFAEGEMVELTPDLKAFFDCWITLDPCQKEAVLQVMNAMKGITKQHHEKRDAGPHQKVSSCVP